MVKLDVDAFDTLSLNLVGFTPRPGSPSSALHTLHNDSLYVILKLLVLKCINEIKSPANKITERTFKIVMVIL